MWSAYSKKTMHLILISGILNAIQLIDSHLQINNVSLALTSMNTRYPLNSSSVITVITTFSNGSIYLIRVDNQRIDYMVAYENHMVDVQKELYLLREKVHEIATDRYAIKKKSGVANETYNWIRLLLSCNVSCFY